MEPDRLIVCVHCGDVNRVPAGRDAKTGRCGTCHQKLFDGHPGEVDAAMFERQIARSSLPVVVDVWAPWCGPCHAMAPAFQAAAADLEPDVRFLKLNSDAEPALTSMLRVRGIPTMILFKDGKEVARQPGAMTQRQITQWLGQKLAN